eukprot:m.97336 g.97336  ORF g.97336 m.97336 type:complete len:694 (+) comp12395_c0_seq1:466-2547(+)
MGCGNSSMALDKGTDVLVNSQVAMRVKFWGTRGSIAKAGPTTVRFGGNTSCIEVRTKKSLIILDCGTGAHGLGQSLLAQGPLPLKGHILITHTHWDHIQGIPFFAPLFVPGCEWDIYAPRGMGHSLQEALAGQMQYTYFPVQLDKLAATIRYHELVEGEFMIDDVKVHTQYLNHPALTLGYRLEVDGVTAVYACDHEPFGRDFALGKGEMSELDRQHVKFLDQADLCIHDAQYTAEDYAQKIGWGHSSVDCTIKLCRAANVRKCALTHHDPMRTDDAVDALVAEAQKSVEDMEVPMEIFGAAEGLVVDLVPSEDAAYLASKAKRKQSRPVTSAMSEMNVEAVTVVAGVGEENFRKPVLDALRADHDFVTTIEADKAEGVLTITAEKKPALVVIDKTMAGGDAAVLAKQVAELGTTMPPVIVIASRDDATAGVPCPGITDWLVEPFSEEYARTKLRAWAMRCSLKWQNATVPTDEIQRMADLRSLHILDSPDDAAFNKLTRITAAAFKVPISIVSLVDSDRQWFKSCFGMEEDTKETPRDHAFCAHAILRPEPLIVPDTHQDERFADNPLVIGPPHIRFYAGAPLQLPSGSRVGTLCAIDSRPRDLDPSQIQLLKDLASLVVEQLVKMPSSVHTAHPAASSIGAGNTRAPGASVPEIFEAAAKKAVAPTSAIVPTACNPAESETPAQQTSNAAG